ncbi:hypothetical protein QA601_08480 [Chitinispirillales bacterium ANBcel5]|uniref:hypothetical protein n=1 Tax=Cellulosispirillum alkaliphilum TaxID=3039283 RepID=UPI002A54383B|nr:hypothetical protein [Chitinispirillales bacterium ANBcel5]
MLIDVSASMSLFEPQKTVLPMLASLKSLENDNPDLVSFSLYSFGDSLREIDDYYNLEFSDRKSHYPLPFNHQGNRSEHTIIISDGHWTNHRLPPETFSHSTFHYLELPKATPSPYLEMNIFAPQSASANTPVQIEVQLIGYSDDYTENTVTLSKNNAILKQEVLESDSGRFSLNTRLTVTESKPGMNLYTIEAKNSSGDPKATHTIPLKVYPDYISYSIHTQTPSLDVRFLSQNLLENDLFRRKNSDPDVLFITEWDDEAQTLLNRLSDRSIAVFISSLPCKQKRLTCPHFNLVSQPYFNAKDFLHNLPNPDYFITCPNGTFSGEDVFLAVSLPECSPDETVPILSTARFQNRRILLCAVSGIWKWDFLPMAIERDEQEKFLFSSKLLDRTKELLLTNLSDSLFIYPSGELSENDSLRLKAVLPSQIPVFSPLRMSFSITSKDFGMDTTVSVVSSGALEESIVLPPLAKGSYELTCSLSYEKTFFTAKTSVSVNTDFSEFRVTDQNTSFLQQFAFPMSKDDDTFLRFIFEGADTEKLITQRIEINRSWLLFALIFFLMFTEWIIRRRLKLD